MWHELITIGGYHRPVIALDNDATMSIRVGYGKEARLQELSRTRCDTGELV